MPCLFSLQKWRKLSAFHLQAQQKPQTIMLADNLRSLDGWKSDKMDSLELNQETNQSSAPLKMPEKTRYLPAWWVLSLRLSKAAFHTPRLLVDLAGPCAKRGNSARRIFQSFFRWLGKLFSSFEDQKRFLLRQKMEIEEERAGILPFSRRAIIGECSLRQ